MIAWLNEDLLERPTEQAGGHLLSAQATFSWQPDRVRQNTEQAFTVSLIV